MNDRPSEFNPNDPRTPYEAPHREPLAYDPLNPVPPAPQSSARAGLVLLAMVAALFVIGFIAFSGTTVDENPTAGIPNNPATQEILPGAEPVAPSPGMVQPGAPAAAPETQETAPAPSE